MYDWCNSFVYVGDVSGEFVVEWSGSKVDYFICVEVNKVIVEGGYDFILLVG